MPLGQTQGFQVKSNPFVPLCVGLGLGGMLLLGGCGQGEGARTPENGDTPTATETAPSTPSPSPTATATPTPTPTEPPTAAPTPEPPGEGTLALSFRINEDLQALLREDPEGPFRADIFYGEDVTNLGPRDGAEVLESIYVEEVVLDPGGAPTAVLYVTGALPNVEVAILGFLNSDDEAEGQEGATSPDQWDPVTFPEDNRFLVRRNQETPAEIYFKLLNP